MLARVARMEALLAKIWASAASRMVLPYWSPPVATQDTIIEHTGHLLFLKKIPLSKPSVLEQDTVTGHTRHLLLQNKDTIIEHSSSMILVTSCFGERHNYWTYWSPPVLEQDTVIGRTGHLLLQHKIWTSKDEQEKDPAVHMNRTNLNAKKDMI